MQKGESCPICHTKLAESAPLRAICTALIASRGQASNPRVLCRNYARCTFVCCEACEALARDTLHALSYENALRIMAEGRAPTDKCDVVVLPPISDSQLIMCIIIEETLARLAILIQQMHLRGREQVSLILNSFRNVIDRYFHDDDFTNRCEMLNLESPFDEDSEDGKLFARCVTIFAVWNNTRDERTPFEDAIVTNIAGQLRKTANRLAEGAGAGAPYITFPLQIERAKKMVLKLSTTFTPRYELVRRI